MSKIKPERLPFVMFYKTDREKLNYHLCRYASHLQIYDSLNAKLPLFADYIKEWLELCLIAEQIDCLRDD